VKTFAIVFGSFLGDEYGDSLLSKQLIFSKEAGTNIRINFYKKKSNSSKNIFQQRTGLWKMPINADGQQSE
jgi:hypothetical protein